MANSEDRKYSLEEILLEFKRPETASSQTASEGPPAAEPVQKAPDASVPRHLAQPEETPASENKTVGRPTAKEPEKPDEPAVRPSGRKERTQTAAPREETVFSEHPQVTMKFPAVREMTRQAEEGPRKPLEQKPEPLNFAAFTKREVPPRKAPPPPTEEDKLRNRNSAPWRTAAEPGKDWAKPVRDPAEPPKLRTIDLTRGPIRPQAEPDLDAFDPEEPEKPRKPKKRRPYDLVNRPVEDASQAASRLGRRLGGMAARLLLFFPVVVTALYLTAADSRGLPMPAGFSMDSSPLYYLGLLALCQLLTLLLCWENTVSGLWRLFCGRPTLDTVVTVSSLVSLGYCAAAAFKPELYAGLPYVCVNTVTGFFALLSKRQRYESLRRSYKTLTAGAAPSGVKLYSDGKVQNLAAKTQSGVDVDPRTLAEPDWTERYASLYAPLILVLALALTLSATVLKGNMLSALWSCSAVLASAAPICLLLSSSASGKRLGKKLYTSGSMLLNARAAGRLAKSRWAALRDADLYPAGSVRITGMKIAEDQEPDVVVACAASLLQEVGGGLAKAFTEFARQMYIVPNKPRELRFFDTRGIAATVSGRYVQLGTASYLMRMGIRVSEGLKLKDSIFVAIDSQFAGIFSMNYQAQDAVYASFGLLKQAKVRPVLALRDTNQTQNAVEARFELRRDTAWQPELEERLKYSASAFGKEEDTLALLSRDGLMPFAEVLCAAKKWRRAAILGCVMGTLCAVGGMAIMAFLTGQGAHLAADPLNLLVYLLLWSLPVRLLRGIVTRL